MSIYGDYTHNVLHHQTERDLIAVAEQRRLAHQIAGTGYTTPWWRRLLHSDQRKYRRQSGQAPVRGMRPGPVHAAH